MRELPCAGHTQDAQLDQRPAHDLGVGRFALVAEFGFAFLRQEVLDCIQSRDQKRIWGGVRQGGNGKRDPSYPLEDLLPSDIL